MIALAALSFVLTSPRYPRGSWPIDFHAFYCAGAAVADRADPYRTEPLRTCENASRGFAPGHGVQFAIPAPLPGYALAPFVLLSRFPYLVAASLWTAILLASLALTVAALRFLCDLRVETILAALLLQGAYAIYLGQIVPIVCAATVLAAFFLTRGRDRAAALAAAVAMLEPHLGLPVCLALFIARPGSRAVLLACGATFLIASFALLGPDMNIEYVRDVLPAHALSELSNQDQYSLSYVSYLAGLGARTASGLGTFSYVAMLAAGILAGRAAAARTGLTALLVLVPPAFAVFGGPFVHVQQLAIAIPAALFLACTRLQSARFGAVAVMLLCAPWPSVGFLISNLALVAVTVFVLATGLLNVTAIRGVLASAAALVSLIALHGMLNGIPAPPIGPLDPAQGAALAENGWRRYVEASLHSDIVTHMVAKLPGWIGLTLIALACIAPIRATPATASNPA
jgi:hypothetical protein